MHKTKRILAVALSLVMIVSLVVVGANASQQLDEENGKWVSAWSTSMVDASIDDLFEAIGATDISSLTQKVGLSLLKNVALSMSDISCRSTLQPTIGGEQIRLTLSNVHGTQDVTINRMTAARSTQDSPNQIDASTLRNVTVGGNPIITIPAGATVVTDAIDMPVDALDSVAFTMYIKDKGSIRTVGLIGGDSFIKGGDQTTASSLSSTLRLRFTGDFGEYSVIPFITDMQVLTDPDDNASAAVLIGDSTIANDIPILLSEKLQDNGINVSILQEAIKGNQVTQNGKGSIGNILGQSLINRFERDALSHEGVKYIIVKVGVNDIIHSRCESKRSEYAGIGNAADGGISAEQVVEGYKTVIDMLNAHNATLAEEDQIKLFFVSRSPWKGYTRNLFNKEDGDDIQWTPSIANECVKINQWLYNAANGGADGYTIDGFIDISSMEDENNPGALRSGYTPDGVHFNETAQKAFCNILPESIFENYSTIVSQGDFHFTGLSIFDFIDYIDTKRKAIDFYNMTTVEIPDETPEASAPVESTEESTTEETTTEVTTEEAPSENTSGDEKPSTDEPTTEEETTEDNTTEDNTSSSIVSFIDKISTFAKKVASFFSKLFG